MAGGADVGFGVVEAVHEGPAEEAEEEARDAGEEEEDGRCGAYVHCRKGLVVGAGWGDGEGLTVFLDGVAGHVSVFEVVGEFEELVDDVGH